LHGGADASREDNDAPGARVGRAVEAAAGLPLEVYFRQHIFAPLGMSNTDYVISATQR
jgi:CubicO group peptidase (beta-lactamase class C family)